MVNKREKKERKLGVKKGVGGVGKNQKYL